MLNKISLVTHVLYKEWFEWSIKKLINLKYNKIYVFYPKEWESILVVNKKIEYIPFVKIDEIKSLLKELVEGKNDEFIIPYFRGEIYSKYMIYVWNLYGKDFDWKYFRNKDKMDSLMEEVVPKFFQKVNKKDLVNIDYDSLSVATGKREFIIKPLDRSSSMEVFRFDSQLSFDEIQNKLSKSDVYILEEYLSGLLYSVDFFFNWEDILFLAHVKETPFVEWIERKKLGEKFLGKYGDEIIKNFLYFLPVRYTMSNFRQAEIQFFQKVRDLLRKIKFHGIIHLEYKYNKDKDEIWFIERGARLGGQRAMITEKLHFHDVRNLMYDVFAKKDISKWEEKNWLYFFKDKKPDVHIVWIKANVLKKTNLFSIFSKIPKYMNISFEWYLCQLLDKYRGIEAKDFMFNVKWNQKWEIYPFYESNKTQFTYFFELNEENFKIFRKKQVEIVEKFVFHDYEV